MDLKVQILKEIFYILQPFILIIRLMQTIRKFFSEFDMFCAPALLRIKEEPEMKSVPAGIISFALACFFLYVFIISSIDVINYAKIDSTLTSTVIKSSQAQGTFPMFAITLDFMDLDNFTTTFEFTTQIYQLGVFIKQVPMRRCHPEQWKLLGDTYQTDFTEYFLDYMLCPDTSQQFQLKQTFKSNIPTYIWVALTACTPSNITNSTCDPSLAAPYLQARSSEPGDGAAVIWVYILDKAIAPDKKDPVQYYIDIDTRVQLSRKFGGAATVQFSSFYIETDMSIWPIEQPENISGITMTTIRNYQSSFDDIQTDVLGRVLFTMNQDKTIMKRKVGKIDELLSYAGGLFSIVIGFLAFFLLSFNQYRYELVVAEGVFCLDETGKKVKQSDLNFLRYIKYTIFDWVQVLFCCQLPWDDCKKINQTREQIINQMEVSRIFKRISNLEMAIKHSIPENQRICLNILQQPSIDRMRKQRLILDYYDTVIGGNSAPTIEDVKIVNNTMVTTNSNLMEPENNGPVKIGDSFQSVEDNSFSMLERDKKNQDNTQTLQKISQNFPQIQKQAQQVQLDEDQEQIEIKIAQAFKNLTPESRLTLQDKIPIIILQRLWKRIKDIDNRQMISVISFDAE